MSLVTVLALVTVSGVLGVTVPPNRKIATAFSWYGPDFTKRLEAIFSQDAYLPDISVKFEGSPKNQEKSKGHLNLTQTTLRLGTPFELVRVTSSPFVVATAVGKYEYRVPSATISLRYDILNMDQTLSGTLIAKLADVNMDATLVASNKTGSCDYMGFLLFNRRQPFKQKVTEVKITPLDGPHSADPRKKAELILKSYVTKRMLYQKVNEGLVTLNPGKPSSKEEAKIMNKYLCGIV